MNEVALNERVWKQFTKGLDFNTKISLADTVKVNENFFIGKQWEGVQSNGLPTPTSNMLKQIVLHQVANITSDNLTMRAIPLSAHSNNKKLELMTEIVSAEFEGLFERNAIVTAVREMMRNAAVDGDGCLFTSWDCDIDMGDGVRGDIRTEVIENTRVLFGNPNDRHVQAQPHIIVWKRRPVEEVRERAKEYGASDSTIANIRPDDDDNNSLMDSYTGSNCTLLLRLRKDRKTGHIFACEVTKGAVVRSEYDMGIRLYPITWLNWDYIQDSYHGQALITGLIPNQQFVNKALAMSMMSMMMSAFPKIVYDKTRVGKWTNQVGAQIGVNGNVDGIAKVIEPAQISPQIFQFIESVVEMTQSLTGATAAALGNTRPDNTSAIIALQKAASIPSEITKMNLYQCIEDLGRIYVEFMANYYGKREVDVAADKAQYLVDPETIAFAGLEQDAPINVKFDFAELKSVPMRLRLDVGASSYWSEIASMQTMENLLQLQMIDIVDFLERIPDGYVAKRQELLQKYKGLQAQQAAAPTPNMSGETTDVIEQGEEMPIPTGGGYAALQRKINEQGIV